MDSFFISKKKLVTRHFTSTLPRVTMTPAFYCPSLLQPPSLDTSVLPLPSPSTTLSLLCPISLARQQVPVRTRACSHLQTFDLGSAVNSLSFQTFLRMKNFTRIALGHGDTAAFLPDTTAEFSCPVCRASGSLYVDRLLEAALATLGDNVTEMVVTEEGKVLPGVRESIQVPGVVVLGDSPYTPLPLQEPSPFPAFYTPGSPRAARTKFSFQHLSSAISPVVTRVHSTSSYQSLDTAMTEEVVDRPTVGRSSLAPARRSPLARCLDSMMSVSTFRRRYSTVDLTVGSPV